MQDMEIASSFRALDTLLLSCGGLLFLDDLQQEIGEKAVNGTGGLNSPGTEAIVGRIRNIRHGTRLGDTQGFAHLISQS